MGRGPSKEPDISTSQPATNTVCCLACHTTHTCQCKAFDRGARIVGMKMKRIKTSLFIAKSIWNVASRAARLPCLAAESPGTLLRFTFGSIEVVKMTPSQRLRKHHGSSNVSSKTSNGLICYYAILSFMSSATVFLGKWKMYFYSATRKPVLFYTIQRERHSQTKYERESYLSDYSYHLYLLVLCLTELDETYWTSFTILSMYLRSKSCPSRAD